MQHVNLDWLSFSVLLIPQPSEQPDYDFIFTTPKDCRMEYYEGNNIYRHRAICTSFSGEKLFTILWSPYSKIIDKRLMLCEIANKWLYSDFSFIIDKIYELHSCQFKCISRVDICCDFNPSSTQMNIIKSLSNGSVYVQSKREGSHFFDISSEDKVSYVSKCISWGSKTSSIKWKLYDKVKELTIIDERTHRKWISKPYIVDLWLRHGLSPDVVWRLEISLTSASKYQYNFKDISLSSLKSPQFVYELFSTLYLKKFVCRRNQGHKDKSNDKIVQLLNFSKIGDFGIPQKETSSSIPEYISILRSLVKQLEQPCVYLVDSIREPLITTLFKVIDEGRLNKYFTDTFKCTPTLFVQRLQMLSQSSEVTISKPLPKDTIVNLSISNEF